MKKKYTAEHIQQMIDYEKNNPDLKIKDYALHWGITDKAYSIARYRHGFKKSKKKYKTRIKSLYPSQAEQTKEIKTLDIELPQAPAAEPKIALFILPLSQVKTILGAL